MATNKTKFGETALGKVLAGGVLLFAANYLHGVFSELESGTRESVSVNWIVATLYKLAGHQGTVLIVVIIGVLTLIAGFRQAFSS